MHIFRAKMSRPPSPPKVDRSYAYGSERISLSWLDGWCRSRCRKGLDNHVSISHVWMGLSVIVVVFVCITCHILLTGCQHLRYMILCFSADRSLTFSCNMHSAVSLPITHGWEKVAVSQYQEYLCTANSVCLEHSPWPSQWQHFILCMSTFRRRHCKYFFLFY